MARRSRPLTPDAFSAISRPPDLTVILRSLRMVGPPPAHGNVPRR
jgi:hypothetical protein